MKRILAMSGVILLVILYISTLVCAIINSPFSVQMFKACVAMTIIIPVLVFGYKLIYKIISDRSKSNSKAHECLDENASEKNE